MLSSGGVLWGAGVLVATGETTLHVLTCAHVVDAALRGRSGELTVDLPGRGWSATVTPVPDSWSPSPPLGHVSSGAVITDSVDFAALALRPGHTRLPVGCGPLPLGPCGPPEGQGVTVVGYPGGAPAGIIATARLTGRGGPCPEWLQLDALCATGAVVEHGFSGSAVWDPVRRRVIGLVTAARTDPAVKVAWMLPVEAAVRLWPPLAGAVRPAGRRVHTRPSLRQQYCLADALLDVPQIGYDSGRSLREALPPAIRRNIRDSAWPRQQLHAVVQACMDHQDGCPTLRAAVLDLAGESRSVSNALGILDRLCGTDESGSGSGA